MAPWRSANDFLRDGNFNVTETSTRANIDPIIVTDEKGYFAAFGAEYSAGVQDLITLIVPVLPVSSVLFTTTQGKISENSIHDQLIDFDAMSFKWGVADLSD